MMFIWCDCISVISSQVFTKLVLDGGLLSPRCHSACSLCVFGIMDHHEVEHDLMGTHLDDIQWDVKTFTLDDMSAAHLDQVVKVLVLDLFEGFLDKHTVNLRRVTHTSQWELVTGLTLAECLHQGKRIDI